MAFLSKSSLLSSLHTDWGSQIVGAQLQAAAWLGPG